MTVKTGCETCGGVHLPMKFKIGGRVRALSMMPHILRDNPFGCRKVDHTGDVGVVVKAASWETIKSVAYIVNFEPDPTKAWEQASFDECMLEAADGEAEYKPLGAALVHWHEHVCPQCFCTWTCGKEGCDPAFKRFCPFGELCHVAPDGSWRVTPETIRKGRGVGSLFDTRDIPVVSPYREGDQGLVTEKR